MLQETRPDPPWHLVHFRVCALDIRLETSPCPFSDANKLVRFLILHEVVELKYPPKFMPKNRPVFEVVLRSYFSPVSPNLFCTGSRGFKLFLALLVRNNRAQMEKIDSVCSIVSVSRTDLSH